MAEIVSDAGLLFVDVGMKGVSGNMRFIASQNDEARIKEFLTLELPTKWRKQLEAAALNGITGTVNNLNISVQKPTYIVFQTTNKNWSFDKSVPIDMMGPTNNGAGKTELIQITGVDNCFILFNAADGASLYKYSLFVDVKTGTGSSASVTKLIIDPDMGSEGDNTGP